MRIKLICIPKHDIRYDDRDPSIVVCFCAVSREPYIHIMHYCLADRKGKCQVWNKIPCGNCSQTIFCFILPRLIPLCKQPASSETIINNLMVTRTQTRVQIWEHMQMVSNETHALFKKNKAATFAVSEEKKPVSPFTGFTFSLRETSGSYATGTLKMGIYCSNVNRDRLRFFLFEFRYAKVRFFEGLLLGKA